MGCAPEQLISGMRPCIERMLVWGRGCAPPNGRSPVPTRPSFRFWPCRRSNPTRSLQQKRNEECRRDSMTFEEAVVAAIDFHGALTGTGSYAPPPEARGGKHKGAGVGRVSRILVLRAGGRSKRGRRHRRSYRPQSLAAHDCGRALNPVSVEGPKISLSAAQVIQPHI